MEDIALEQRRATEAQRKTNEAQRITNEKAAARMDKFEIVANNNGSKLDAILEYA